MLVVTHEMGFARDVADDVVFMDKGQIVDALLRTKSSSVPSRREPAPFSIGYSTAKAGACNG